MPKLPFYKTILLFLKVPEAHHPTARLSEEFCLSKGSQGPLQGFLRRLGSSSWGWCRWGWSEFPFLVFFLLPFPVVFAFCLCFFFALFFGSACLPFFFLFCFVFFLRFSLSFFVFLEFSVFCTFAGSCCRWNPVRNFRIRGLCGVSARLCGGLRDFPRVMTPWRTLGLPPVGLLSFAARTAPETPSEIEDLHPSNSLGPHHSPASLPPQVLTPARLPRVWKVRWSHGQATQGTGYERTS